MLFIPLGINLLDVFFNYIDEYVIVCGCCIFIFSSRSSPKVFQLVFFKIISPFERYGRVLIADVTLYNMSRCWVSDTGLAISFTRWAAIISSFTNMLSYFLWGHSVANSIPFILGVFISLSLCVSCR